MKKRSKKEELELQKQLEKYQHLPRKDRRKKERELQKQFHDKTITIKSGKKFTKKDGLSRKEQRLLLKDKNFLNDLRKIIRKYLPDLTNLFSSLTDTRHQGHITYKMRTIMMIRLFALLCGITTMTEINSKFNTEHAIKNLSTICNQELKEIPNWQTIQDVIETLNCQEIDEIRKYIFTALLRSKMFDRFRYNGAIQLIIDATGLTALDSNLNNNCLSRTRDGKTKYYKYVLEAKVVFGNFVISIDSEWIENTNMNNEKQKQDCETNAFKRMASRIKKNYPKLKFIVTGDALYATTPIIDICEENQWYYIFNLKQNRLKTVFEQFEDNIHDQNEVTKENYFLSSEITFKENTFNAFRYIEIKNMKTTTFNYISNLPIDSHNIEHIVAMGRKRWKIENEGFNEQKNGTFNISHLCSKHENGLKIHYFIHSNCSYHQTIIRIWFCLCKRSEIFCDKKRNKHFNHQLAYFFNNHKSSQL